MTPRVLHVAQPVDAGVPRVASSLVADQVERGWDVCVASPPDGDLRVAAEAAGARWHSWPATRQPGPATAGETRRLAAILRAVDPELVHLHSAKAGLAGRLTLRGRVPTVFQPHAWSFEAAGGLTGRGAAAWERFGARWADLIVCVSADERLRGESHGVHASYEVVPNGVDLGLYAPASAEDRAAARAALGVAGDAPLAVTVGRLAPQKGQDVLLPAWRRVLERVPDAQLVLLGDGPDREALLALETPHVRFAGDGQDVAQWLAAANVSVIPSRWEAGLSLVAMEAMARGRSVVASAVAGMAEGLEGGCGAVVAPEDEGALADAVAERLADPALADREGLVGRARVEERYDVHVASARMAEVYMGVLERRGVGVPAAAVGSS
jgi:glycosyltransferase involved in cell wall biosynthesis